jgi:lysophospholipase L1-like esterase
LLWALAVLLATAAYLRSLCLGAPPARLLSRATCAALAPAGALLALRPWVAVPYEPLLLLLAGVPGLRLALRVLRDHVHVVVPSGVRGGARILILVASLAGLAAWVHGQARATALRPEIAAAERALPEVSSRPFDLAAPLALDATNALTAPGPWRSFDLETEVTLAPNSLLELRLRAQTFGPNGIALFLSSDARWKSGFFLEDQDTFRALGDDFGQLPAGRAQVLALRVVGDDFEASLDGRRVASARLRAFPSGSVVALAARGEARLSRLALRPRVPEPPVRDASDEAWAVARVPWILLAFLTVAAALLLAVPWPRALEGAAWLLAPLVFAVHVWAGPEGQLPLATFLVTLVACLGFALPWVLLHSRRAGPWRTAAFLVLAPLSFAAALYEGTGPPLVESSRTSVTWDQFDLPRIEPGLSHLQHPSIRCFNTYLIDHTFRARRFTLEPAPGVVRVVSVGTSSTWGHGIEPSTGLDYPTVLEGLLAERLPGQRIEVINGAVRDSTVARLLRVFRESLLAFHPEIVTLSVYYNDSAWLTQVDEEAFLTRIGRPGYEHTWVERVRELLRRKNSKRVMNHIWKSLDEKQGDSLGSWREVVTDPEVSSPPARFEAGLRAFAELGREHRFQLVLIKEPIRGDPPRIWRDEFRAVMDRLGEEYGLSVVDPNEALAAAGGRSLFMDEIHPLPEGHRVMAEVLAPVIEDLIRRRAGSR